MPREGFLDENAGRSYPFLAGTVGQPEPGPDPGSALYLPDSAILDFGALLGLNAGFVEDEHIVYLAAVRRQDDQFEFEFRSTAPGLSQEPLIFCRNLEDPRHAVEYADSVDQSSDDDSDEPGDCQEEPGWSGYLVTGDLTDLADLLSSGQELTGTATQQVEPALLRNLAGSYVRAINAANGERTRVTAREGCREPCWPFAPADLYVVGRCLQGNVRFEAGYNCSIRVQDDLLEFSAGIGLGAGEPCEEVPIFPAEAPPTNSELLTGGNTCDEGIRSINGIGGRLLQIVAGRGVTVTPVPADNSIEINVDFHDMALCVSIPDTDDCSEESGDSDDDDPCDCGPE